ncbi:SET domain-containing protein-lysine N-methyltransferase [Roseateles aquatilis]|uniref:SET domain-containing protein-lysine N-methyltransferase n=1 Tax=Roseateles aquatilis TaxID=431061 RepID=A0A246ISC3_9BURK|nr:SET domain-containing protein-lysine N-methyltransferase [Roseateles aquatilis]
MPRLSSVPSSLPEPVDRGAGPSAGPARRAEGRATGSVAASATKGQPQPAERFALSVGPSPIDGLGVFADEAIPARRKIGEMRGEVVPVREARRRIEGRRRIHVVEVSNKTAIDATKSDCALRHVNHSCSPNAVLRIRQGRAEFYAMRDIDTGEEIVADYGESHHEGRLRCRCGAPNCKGRL